MMVDPRLLAWNCLLGGGPLKWGTTGAAGKGRPLSGNLDCPNCLTAEKAGGGGTSLGHCPSKLSPDDSSDMDLRPDNESGDVLEAIGF